ncbi:MAG: tetratricopeptide repeat protein [Planctomycetia bacterium]|nr:tetratricopeptide repeat protein [Planctomycetia bacterium]
MTRKLFFATTIVGAITFTVSPLWAIDIVTLKSTTKQVQGEIGAINKTEVAVKPRTGDPIKVPANDIASVKWDGEPAKLNIARGNEDRGLFDQALETYSEVHKDAIGKLKVHLEFLIARTLAKQALEDASKIDDAVKKLEAFSKNDHFAHFEAVSYLGQVYAVKGDFAKSQTAYEALGKAPWNDFKMASKIAVGRMQLKQNDISGAEKSFGEAASGKADTDAEKARFAEAQVGKAACLVKQMKIDEGLKLIDEVINTTSVDETRAMAEAYIIQGDCLQAQQKLKEAAIAYLHVPVLFPKEKSAHAEALYNLAKISGAIGQPDRAAEAREDLISQFPNSEWVKKLGDAPAAAATEEKPAEKSDK